MILILFFYFLRRFYQGKRIKFKIFVAKRSLLNWFFQINISLTPYFHDFLNFSISFKILDCSICYCICILNTLQQLNLLEFNFRHLHNFKNFFNFSHLQKSIFTPFFFLSVTFSVRKIVILVFCWYLINTLWEQCLPSSDPGFLNGCYTKFCG